jgi:chaperone LolA
MTLEKIFLICTFLLSSMQLHASELTNYLNNLNSFQAGFSQTILTTNNNKKKQSKGIIVVKSPNKFYLQYNKPFKLLYVADGKKLWSYDEDLEQVVVKEQGNLLINSPAMLLGNAKNLKKSYHIKKTGVIDGWLWFELTPKQENSNFEKVSLAFEDGKIIAMGMIDNFGQITRLEFNNIIKNPKLTKSQFRFVPPKGVDVIGQ